MPQTDQIRGVKGGRQIGVREEMEYNVGVGWGGGGGGTIVACLQILVPMLFSNQPTAT
jgi:hypothetical protein